MGSTFQLILEGFVSKSKGLGMCPSGAVPDARTPTWAWSLAIFDTVARAI